MRKVLTWAVGIVACLIAATISFWDKLVWDMAPKMSSDPPAAVCDDWPRFLAEVRDY